MDTKTITTNTKTTIDDFELSNIVLNGFYSVGEFHDVFEHPKKTVPDTEIFTKNPKLVELRTALIQEEYNELLDAIKTCNYIEVADALSDILYVVYGAGHSYGINLPEVYKKKYGLVNIKNYYDVCNTEKQKKYLELKKEFFNTYKSDIDYKLLILSEMLNEFKDNIKDENINDIGDTLVDIINMVYTIGFRTFGINLYETFKKVHESNMTKACINEQEAIDTIKYIKEKDTRYKEPVYKLSKNGKYWIIYDKSTGKTLKSKYYKAVDLSYLDK